MVEAQAALEEEKNKFLRLFAEFENYKKRTAKERVELFKTRVDASLIFLIHHEELGCEIVKLFP